jgi:hypothetical protein
MEDGHGGTLLLLYSRRDIVLEYLSAANSDGSEVAEREFAAQTVVAAVERADPTGFEQTFERLDAPLNLARLVESEVSGASVHGFLLSVKGLKCGLRVCLRSGGASARPSFQMKSISALSAACASRASKTSRRLP